MTNQYFRSQQWLGMEEQISSWIICPLCGRVNWGWKKWHRQRKAGNSTRCLSKPAVEFLRAECWWGESREERKNKLKFWNRIRKEVITGKMSGPKGLAEEWNHGKSLKGGLPHSHRHDILRQRPGFLLMLLEWSSISVTSMLIYSQYIKSCIVIVSQLLQLVYHSYMNHGTNIIYS